MTRRLLIHPTLVECNLPGETLLTLANSSNLTIKCLIDLLQISRANLRIGEKKQKLISSIGFSNCLAFWMLKRGYYHLEFGWLNTSRLLIRQLSLRVSS
ncbi:hypothetical protein B2G88_18385 [Natronolimnobius baerhuensis]|uniref:Uncharacterized protein n=1 Tax=Natronolimnobius baerhuensis TaxID=253108 RepID=A0A202E450_9EURY|nr:hypothetical protein B2G88_18385 [Natronolimnobius baerhuensis]